MKKNKLTLIMAILLMVFYVGIVSYIFYAVVHIETLRNFVAAIIFEIIGVILLAYFILGNVLTKPIRIGYFVPLLIITVVYTVILDIINFFCVVNVSNLYFILINLIVLFIYCLISFPMYIMGRK